MEDLLASALTVDRREGTPDASGRRTRVLLVKVPFKYPLLRVEETLGQDRASGAEAVLDRKVCVADHILVQVDAPESAAILAGLNRRWGATVLRQLAAPGLCLVQFPRPTLDTVPEQIDRYTRLGAGVRFAEPDYIVFAEDTFPDDPSFGDLWSLHNTGQTGGTADADIDAPEAWDVTTGNSGVIVAVVDSGADGKHEDLSPNLWVNPDEIPGNGVDDEGNGFIDDVNGWDFVNGDADPFDDNRHGTHVAGTIAAAGDNGKGIVGSAWRVRLMPLKCLAANGYGATSDAVDALYYSIAVRQRGAALRVSNNSWGGGGFQQSLLDAVRACSDAGILFVAAAGNSAMDNDASPHYPSSYDSSNIVSVAATDHNDALASFSNHGATSVDLAAPGVNIVSTLPGGLYGALSGTSMSAPCVAGVAALVWSLNDAATVQEVREALLGGVDPVAGLAGKVATGGRLNAWRALQQLGMLVTGSDPAAGGFVAAPPTDFAISFSSPYDPSTVQAGDFTVNGIPAASFAAQGPEAVAFRFAVSPVTSQGAQAMAIAPEAIARLLDGDGVAGWTAEFRYDVTRLAVTNVAPSAESVLTLPFGTLVVQVNEALDPASVDPSDLIVSQGTVTQAFVSASNSVAYTLTGLTGEGRLEVRIPAGAFTDFFGNPNLPFSATYTLDYGDLPLEGKFRPVDPRGGLVYDASSTGVLSPDGDTDAFLLSVDGDQTLSVVATPLAEWSATVALTAPQGSNLAVAASAGPGGPAVIQAIPVGTGGVFRVAVSSAGATTGAYSVAVVLNAALENESQAGPANDALAQAQDLDASFINVAGGGAERGAVLGTLELVPFYSEAFDAGDGGFLFEGDYGSGGGLWHRSTGRRLDGRPGHSPPGSLYYGQGEDEAGNGDYDTGAANGGAAVSPVISLPVAPGARLKFSHFLETEGKSAWDVATVAVDDGAGFVTIASTEAGTLPMDTGGAWGNMILDLSAFAGLNVRVRFAFDTIDSFVNNPEGWYVDDVFVGTPSQVDFYRFTLEAGQVASLAACATKIEPVTLELQDASGTVLASGIDTGEGCVTVSGFVAPSNASYYAKVGGGDTDYTLLVTRGALWNGASTGVTAAAQDVSRSRSAMGWVSADPVQAADTDVYRMSVTAGTISVSTLTPAGGALDFRNTLDPVVSLLDSNGVFIVGDDNSGADGRNAHLMHVSPTAGVFLVSVYAAAGTAGEYTLSVDGTDRSLPPFRVIRSNPAGGSHLGTSPVSVTLEFSEGLLLGSVDPGDLLIDGLPASSVSAVDGRTLRFAFPPLAEGNHVLSIGPGAVTSIAGAPVEGYETSLLIDASAPRILAVSIGQGAAIPAGATACTVVFSEPMDALGLDVSDVRFAGLVSGGRAVSSLAYDTAGNTLVLELGELRDDTYTLTLLSGDGRFEDRAGNDLDGEAPGTSLPPGVSGDGNAGGDFVLAFSADASTTSLGPLLANVNPAGSLLHEAELGAVAQGSNDVDTYTLDLDAGQTISAGVMPGIGLRPRVAIRDPHGAVAGQIESSAAGRACLVQAVPVTEAGAWQVESGAAGGTEGAYRLRVLLNGTLEDEEFGGESNDVPVAAEALDASFLPLPDTAASRSGAWGVAGDALVVSPLQAEQEPNDDGVPGAGTNDLPLANNWSGSFTPFSVGSFRAALTGAIDAGDDFDWDFFRITARPGDVVEIFLKGAFSGSGTLNDPYLRILDARGQLLGFDDDSGEGLDSHLRFSGFPEYGPYYIVADSFGGEVGTYALEAVLETPALLRDRVPGVDWLSLALEPGDRMTMVVTPISGGALDMGLYGADGTPLATGEASRGGALVVSDYLAATGGAHLVKVAGDADYSVVVTRGATFDFGENGTAAFAQDLGASGCVLGHVGSSADAQPPPAAMDVQLPALLFDGEAYVWDVQQDGSILNGLVDAFDSGLVHVGFPSFLAAAGEEGGRELVLGPATNGVFLVTRKVYVSPTLGFARFLEIVSNTSTGAASYPLEILTDLGSDAATQVLDTSSGDHDFSTNDLWLVTDDVEGDADPTVLHVIAGEGGQGPASASLLADVVSYTFDVEVPPGATRIVMHFSAQSGNGAMARTRAIELAALGSGSLQGLSKEEAACIVNFIASDSVDFYRFPVGSGTLVRVRTSTPLDGPLEPPNDLDARLDLYDPDGRLMASNDDGGIDARNARIVSAAATGGMYSVRVTGATSAEGEYVLCVDSAAPSEGADVSVSMSAPLDGVAPGCLVNMMVAISNAGPATAEGIRVTTIPHPALPLVAATSSVGACSFTNVVVCDIVALAPGESATLRVASLAGATGNLESLSLVACSGFDPIASNDSATVVVNVSSAGVETQGLVRLVAGLPVISSDPAGGDQNNSGDRLDLDTSGGALVGRRPCGPGAFGGVYVNYDATNLYVGAAGCDMAGSGNGMILFLGLSTLTNDAGDLLAGSGNPGGLDGLGNLRFDTPVDIAVLVGDEFGDGTFPSFVLGDGVTDFGQGVFLLGGASFAPVPGARLSQFDGNGQTPTVSADDDGDRLTDRWEAAIPWTSLEATGMLSVSSLQMCGVMAGPESGGKRYLLGNYLGASASSSTWPDENNAFGYADVRIEGLAVQLPDSDGDGLPDWWEFAHSLDYGDDGSVNPDHGSLGDPDGDGFANADEYAAGTDPRNSTSLLRALAVTRHPASGAVAVSVGTESGRVYRIEFSDGGANDGFWSPFANPDDGVGTWLELRPASTNHSFVDDFSPATTGGQPPAGAPRLYRIRAHGR